MSAEVDGSRRYRALLKQTLQEDEDLVQVVRLKWVKLLRPGLVLLGAFLMALVIAAYLPLSLGYRTVLSLAVLVVGSDEIRKNETTRRKTNRDGKKAIKKKKKTQKIKKNIKKKKIVSK
jgi:hypothetical protein